MDLRLQDGSFVENCVKVKIKADITPDKRLFYELGEYTQYKPGYGWADWKPSGVFKEITDVSRMLELDKELERQDYINHHNFYTEAWA